MFGKPEWFRERRDGWGVVPVSWQGFGYSTGWIAVISAPFAGLALQGLFVESLIWLVAAAGALWWDVRQVVSEIRASKPAEEVFYIGDEVNAEDLETRNFNLRLR